MVSSDGVAVNGKKRGLPLFKYEVNVGSALTAGCGVLINVCLVFWAFDNIRTGYENRVTTLETSTKIQHDWLATLSQDFESYKQTQAQQERSDLDAIATARSTAEDKATGVAMNLQDFEASTERRLNWLELTVHNIQDALARIQYNIVPKRQIQ